MLKGSHDGSVTACNFSEDGELIMERGSAFFFWEKKIVLYCGDSLL